MFDMYQIQKRVVRSTDEERQGGVQSGEALTRDRTERRAAGSHSGRIWVRGFYRLSSGGQRSWVRGHWASPGERVGRSGAE